jgi:hypothetical protein
MSPFVPISQARERASLASPSKAGQRSEPDHGHDHVLVAAAISCQTRRQGEPDRGHDRVVLAVRSP